MKVGNLQERVWGKDASHTLVGIFPRNNDIAGCEGYSDEVKRRVKKDRYVACHAALIEELKLFAKTGPIWCRCGDNKWRRLLLIHGPQTSDYPENVSLAQIKNQACQKCLRPHKDHGPDGREICHKRNEEACPQRDITFAMKAGFTTPALANRNRLRVGGGTHWDTFAGLPNSTIYFSRLVQCRFHLSELGPGKAMVTLLPDVLAIVYAHDEGLLNGQRAKPRSDNKVSSTGSHHAKKVVLRLGAAMTDVFYHVPVESMKVFFTSIFKLSNVTASEWRDVYAQMPFLVIDVASGELAFSARCTVST